MNYDTETWYKLYIRESTEDRLLPVFNRALRDFLLRLAKSRDNATILGKTENPGEDLARALNAHPSETPLIVAYVASMLEDGYLTHRRGRLWITNFVAAQQAVSPGARRQKRWRQSKTKSSPSETSQVPNSASHGDVSRDAHDTLDPIRDDPNRSETRRDETTARAGDPPTDAFDGVTEVVVMGGRPPEPPPERPTRPRELLATRIGIGAYQPLPGHTTYAAALNLTPAEAGRALIDMRDKCGDKRHDVHWFDDRFCDFLDQAARSKKTPRAPTQRPSRADEITRELLARGARLKADEDAQDAAAAAGKAGVA